MPSARTRTYLPAAKKAAELLGKMIKVSRLERKMTESDLAARAGVTRKTLQRIERGDPQCGIGLFFELAVLVGVNLFEADTRATIEIAIERTDGKLAVLPKRVRQPLSSIKVDDDF